MKGVGDWANIYNYWWIVFLQHEAKHIMGLDKASIELAYRPLHLWIRGAR